MATIEYRKDRRKYRVKVRRKGAPPLTATFTDLTDAKKWAKITEGAVLEGRYFPSPEAKRHTVTDMIERYVCEVLPYKSTSHAYMQRLQLNWWRKQFGHYILSDVTPARITECRDLLLRTRKTSTVNRYLAALSFAYTIATREWQWCDDNPVHRIMRPPEPQGRVRFLSDDERTRLLEACKMSRNPVLYIVVVIALSTGARKMEILGLTWKDVDLQHGAIHLQKTKNKERRILPLTSYALELMQQHVKIQCSESLWVFPNKTSTRPCRIREAWENALKRAEIENFKFHDLRHSAASYMLMNGASLAEIGEILGHKSFEMTKRYAHLSDNHTRNVVERMNQAIFGQECDQA
jgi:integrase